MSFSIDQRAEIGNPVKGNEISVVSAGSFCVSGAADQNEILAVNRHGGVVTGLFFGISCGYNAGETPVHAVLGKAQLHSLAFY